MPENIFNLEEALRGMEGALNAERSKLREASQKVLDAKTDLVRLTSFVAAAEGRIHRMKFEYPVVLLREYAQATYELKSAKVMREQKLDDIQRHTKRGIQAADAVKKYETQQRLLQQKIDTADSNVIPFRR